jgi:hypothetical protein
MSAECTRFQVCAPERAARNAASHAATRAICFRFGLPGSARIPTTSPIALAPHRGQRRRDAAPPWGLTYTVRVVLASEHDRPN